MPAVKLAARFRLWAAALAATAGTLAIALRVDGYAYRAETYCRECGEKIYRRIAAVVAPKLAGTGDPLFSDSETCPQPIFFGESDYACHCGDCGEYMYGQDQDDA